MFFPSIYNHERFSLCFQTLPIMYATWKHYFLLKLLKLKNKILTSKKKPKTVIANQSQVSLSLLWTVKVYNLPSKAFYTKVLNHTKQQSDNYISKRCQAGNTPAKAMGLGEERQSHEWRVRAGSREWGRVETTLSFSPLTGRTSITYKVLLLHRYPHVGSAHAQSRAFPFMYMLSKWSHKILAPCS